MDTFNSAIRWELCLSYKLLHDFATLGDSDEKKTYLVNK